MSRPPTTSKVPTTTDHDARRANPRTCIGCRAVRDRAELVRCRLDHDGALHLGPGGRGAWLCRDTLAACCETAAKRGGFARAFRGRVSPQTIAMLQDELGIGAQRGTDARPR